MPRLRLAQPLWLDPPPRGIRLSPLDRALNVDVAIIGGGITGVSAAWLFSAAGHRVALVEAERIARGSTAASTALLMQETDSDFVELVGRYGLRRARRIWQLSRLATRQLIRTLDELEIRCGLSERDSIYVATTDAAARRLRAEFEQRRAARLPAGRWLDVAAMFDATGLPATAGIRTSGNGQVDPYRACLGLARAARRAGARLFEHSPVRRIDVGPQSVTIVTPRGLLRAAEVVVATGYATPFFKPLARHFRLMNTYVLATRRLTASERRELGMDNVMLWDTSRPYHYGRWTADRRLLLGGADRPYVKGWRRAREFQERVNMVGRHFERLWPALSDVGYEFAWEGLFATTPDGLPYIGSHPDYPRHQFALGYGGNGMTFGFLAAKLLLQQHGGRRTSDLGLFAFDRLKSASTARRRTGG